MPETETPFALLPAPGTFLFSQPVKGKQRTRAPFALSSARLYREFTAKYETGYRGAPAPLSLLHPGGRQNLELTFNTPLYLLPLTPLIAPSPLSPFFSGGDGAAVMPGKQFSSMIFSALFSSRYSVSNLNQLLNKNLSYSASPMELVMYNIAARVLRSSVTLDAYGPGYLPLQTPHSRRDRTLRPINQQHQRHQRNLRNLRIQLKQAGPLSGPTQSNRYIHVDDFNKESGPPDYNIYINREIHVDHFNKKPALPDYNTFNNPEIHGPYRLFNIQPIRFNDPTAPPLHILHSHSGAAPPVNPLFSLPERRRGGQSSARQYPVTLEQLVQYQNRWLQNRVLQKLYLQRYNTWNRWIRRQNRVVQVREIHTRNVLQKYNQYNKIRNQNIQLRKISNTHHPTRTFHKYKNHAFHAEYFLRHPSRTSGRSFPRHVSYTSSPMELLMNSIYTRTKEDNFKWTLMNLNHIRADYPQEFHDSAAHRHHRDYDSRRDASLRQDPRTHSWNSHLNRSEQFTSKDAGFVSNLFSALFTSTYHGSNISWAFRKTLSYTASPMEIMLHGITTRVLEESYKTHETLRQKDRKNAEKHQAKYRLQRYHLPPGHWLTGRMSDAGAEEPTVIEQLWGHVTDSNGENVLKPTGTRQYGRFPTLEYRAPNNSALSADAVKQIQKKIVTETKQIQSQLEKNMPPVGSPSSNNANVNLSQLTNGVYNKIVERIKRERSMRGY